MNRLIQLNKTIGNGIPRAYQLSNGKWIPSLGLGTVGLEKVESLEAAIMEAGYVYLDTASTYKNEGIVGEALQRCFARGKKREDVFVLTKLDQHEQNDVEKYLRESLARLQLDYVDCYLVHWPFGYFAPTPIPLYKLWKNMEDMVDKGLTASIGVSNFNAQLLWDMLTYARIKPVVNQVELHPTHAQHEFVRMMKDHGIRPIAYAPISRPGRGGSRLPDGSWLTPEGWQDLRENPVLKNIAANHKKSVVQVMLNWGIQKGHVVIPGAHSYDPKHVQYLNENM